MVVRLRRGFVSPHLVDADEGLENGGVGREVGRGVHGGGKHGGGAVAEDDGGEGAVRGEYLEGGSHVREGGEGVVGAEEGGDRGVGEGEAGVGEGVGEG